MSQPPPNGGRTFTVREVDSEKKIENRLTHLETREKDISERLSQTSEKVREVESTTIVMKAVSESTKAQKNAILVTLGVTFAGISVIATITKLFFME